MLILGSVIACEAMYDGRVRFGGIVLSIWWGSEVLHSTSSFDVPSRTRLYQGFL